MRTSRTFARLAWYHVPLRMGPQTKKDDAKPTDDKGKEKEKEEEKAREVHRLMAEKRMALELIEGYACHSSPQVIVSHRL